MSLVDLLLVPEAKSFFSSNATFSPLDAASKAIPPPVIPPPMTTKSNSSLERFVIAFVLFKFVNSIFFIAFFSSFSGRIFIYLFLALSLLFFQLVLFPALGTLHGFFPFFIQAFSFYPVKGRFEDFIHGSSLINILLFP